MSTIFTTNSEGGVCGWAGGGGGSAEIRSIATPPWILKTKKKTQNWTWGWRWTEQRES